MHCWNGVVTSAKMLVLAVAPLIGLRAQAAVPTQFIAKLYTEVDGRGPDPAGWKNGIAYFQQNGCSVSTLAAYGLPFFTSPEFNNLGYSNGEKVLLLYRGILDREPDPSGFNTYLNALNTGASLSSVVQTFYRGSEFANLSSYACSGGSYGFGGLGGSGGAISINGAAIVSGSQLQSQIDSLFKSGGGTITLAQDTVVEITTQPLVLKPGITIVTAGSPTYAHAKMARIVRNASWDDELISVCGGGAFNVAQNQNGPNNPPFPLACPLGSGGGTLTNVWVDGLRGGYNYSTHGLDVAVYSGSNATIANNFLDNPTGNAVLAFYGYSETLDRCTGGRVVNNIVTVYPSHHQYGGPNAGSYSTSVASYADGIRISCEQATVSGNTVVDATDAAIAVGRSCPTGANASSVDIDNTTSVSSNVILSAGNSTNFAIGIDPLGPTGAIGTNSSGACGLPNTTTYKVADFTGATVSSNQIFSGPNSHFVIGLSAGSRENFPDGNSGIGGALTGNDSYTAYGLTATEGTGILNAGLVNVKIQGNTMARLPISLSSCPAGDIVISTSVDPTTGAPLDPLTGTRPLYLSGGNNYQTSTFENSHNYSSPCIGDASSPPQPTWPLAN